ncbi:MAG TPA: NADH dehydrogenase ubiquinone Fe-S protein 4 [Sphingopyxis sp.]|nr:NADH dehydrogenase ubiquinone Fe-S protein 4 [Sphingopyxis sp.]
MLPPDASAIIAPVPLGPNQSGRAHASLWRLRFRPRWAPRADPLTGWTGSGDPLGQIELRFANRDAAELYCRRANIPFEIRGTSDVLRPAAPGLSGEAPPRLCCSPSGPHPLCCGDYPISTHREAQPKSLVASHSAFSFAG